MAEAPQRLIGWLAAIAVTVLLMLRIINVWTTPKPRLLESPDDYMIYLDRVEVLMGPVRSRAWNALWWQHGTGWCSSARADAGNDVTPRCQASHVRWGNEHSVRALLAARVNTTIHMHDGAWLGRCTESGPPPTPSSLDATPVPPNFRRHCFKASLPGHAQTLLPVQLGEAKTFVGPDGVRRLYGYARFQCTSALWCHLPLSTQREYYLNRYKNFMCRFDPQTGGCVADEPALLLHYTRSERPEPRTSIAKNFVLFTHVHRGRAELLAITLAAPHRVHLVNVTTGRMTPLSASLSGTAEPSDSSSARHLSFIDHVGLSAGGLPVTLDDGTRRVLLAGHVRRNARSTEHGARGMRMTFFYVCEPTPPYAITAVTPLINFGLSPTLEYLNHMEIATNSPNEPLALYLSVGADDCGTALLRVSLSAVLRELRPLPLVWAMPEGWDFIAERLRKEGKPLPKKKAYKPPAPRVLARRQKLRLKCAAAQAVPCSTERQHARVLRDTWGDLCVEGMAM